MDEKLVEGQKEFNLAKLRKLKPSGLIDENENTDDKFDQFFLTLALIYNDFKGLAYFDHYISSFRKLKPGEITGHAGEFLGVKLQIFKLASGYVLEVLKFLEENRSINSDDKFKVYLRKLSRQDYEIWDLLFSIATGCQPPSLNNEKSEQLKKLLAIIRGNFTFHYQWAGAVLAKGFRKHFFKRINQDDSYSKSAFYSLIQTGFYENRFYYIDASVAAYLDDYIGTFCEKDKIFEIIIDLLVKISKVIAGLLEQYFKDKPKA